MNRGPVTPIKRRDSYSSWSHEEKKEEEIPSTSSFIGNYKPKRWQEYPAGKYDNDFDYVGGDDQENAPPNQNENREHFYDAKCEQSPSPLRSILRRVQSTPEKVLSPSLRLHVEEEFEGTIQTTPSHGTPDGSPDPGGVGKNMFQPECSMSIGNSVADSICMTRSGTTG